MRRRILALLLSTAVVLTGCTSAVAGPRPLRSVPSASPSKSATSTHTVKVGSLTRSWVQVTAAGLQGSSAPIIVVLSGINATPAQEMKRDDLLGLPATGHAELVYPVGVHHSWNAGGCCGKAYKEHVDDLAFIQAMVPKLDPSHRRPIYLAGYSNGGRLAYRVMCTDPTLFGAYMIVKAMPEPGCVVTKPASILQIDSTNDHSVPYKPGDHGKEHPPATTEVSHLHGVDDCPSSSAAATHGEVRLTTWTDCHSGSRLSFATYTGGKHIWPPNTSTTPGAGTLIWNFITTLTPTTPTPSPA